MKKKPVKNIKNIKITTSRHLKKIELFTQVYYTNEENRLKWYLLRNTYNTRHYHHYHIPRFRDNIKNYFFYYFYLEYCEMNK